MARVPVASVLWDTWQRTRGENEASGSRRSFIADESMLKATKRFAPIIYISFAFAIRRYRGFSVDVVSLTVPGKLRFLDDNRCRKRVGRDKYLFLSFFYGESQATCILAVHCSCSSGFDRARKKRRSIRRSVFQWQTSCVIGNRVSNAVSRDCRYRKSWEVLSIHLAKRKLLLCVGALSAFGYRFAAAGNPDWHTSATGGIFRVVSPRKVSRKQTSHICVIGESANNRTTPGTSADRAADRSIAPISWYRARGILHTHPELSRFHFGNTSISRCTCETVSRD